MTNEQKLLVYLYSVPDMQRKQLKFALQDMPYQSLTLAVRKAKEHGYIESFRRSRSNYVRLTAEGVQYIRSVCEKELDKEKRTGLKKHNEKEKIRRFERIELTVNLCSAAGIPSAKSIGICFSDLIGPASDVQQNFFEGEFLSKGALFSSDDISRALQAERIAGEDYFVFRSRVIGIVFNRNGLFFLYNTLDKLMRWETGAEVQILRSVILSLRKAAYIQTHPLIAQMLQKKPKAIIIGKSCAMIPKIWTGDKWGIRRILPQHQYDVRKSLLNYDNLKQVYSHIYFVPLGSLGVELLDRTVKLSRMNLHKMCLDWLLSYGEFTVLTRNRYIEAYEKGEAGKYILLPIIELDELVYHRSGTEQYHVICERGTQDGISRVAGKKAMEFFDFDFRKLPVHKYDDDGIRMDGVHPLTGNGYLAE